MMNYFECKAIRSSVAGIGYFYFGLYFECKAIRCSIAGIGYFYFGFVLV